MDVMVVLLLFDLFFFFCELFYIVIMCVCEYFIVVGIREFVERVIDWVND